MFNIKVCWDVTPFSLVDVSDERDASVCTKAEVEPASKEKCQYIFCILRNFLALKSVRKLVIRWKPGDISGEQLPEEYAK